MLVLSEYEDKCEGKQIKEWKIVPPGNGNQGEEEDGSENTVLLRNYDRHGTAYHSTLFSW